MPRLIGPGFLTVLAVVTLLVSVDQALASHVQCGEVITQDTTLDSDLIDCPREGIVIGANDVTLDLNGHVVAGTGGGYPVDYCQAGIVSGWTRLCPRATDASYNGVVVRGGAVRDFDFGVQLVGTEDSRVSDVTVSGALSGIGLVEESRRSVITRNRVFDNEIGIGLDKVSQSVVSRNTARGNGAGIGGAEIDESRFEENLLTDNDHGLHLNALRNGVVANNRAARNMVGLEVSDGVFDSLVVGNTVKANDNGIIVFEGTRRNRVERNRVVGNAGAPTFIGDRGLGILVDRETHVEGNAISANGTGILLCCNGRNTVMRNRITRNGEGVRVIGESDGNRIGWNEISHNADGGILVEPGIYWTGAEIIEGNRVSRNGGDGIFLGEGPADAADSVIEGNVSTRNEDDGIDVESAAVSIAANRAIKNGDLGIEAVPGVTDGGRNTAFGNSDPLQCLNVVCKPQGRTRMP